MSDTDDLQEFNKKVAKGPEKTSHEDEFGISFEVDGSDEIDSALANAGAKMWAVYGDAYSPCEKAVDVLPPGQFTIELSQERGIFFSNNSKSVFGYFTNIIFFIEQSLQFFCNISG